MQPQAYIQELAIPFLKTIHWMLLCLINASVTEEFLEDPVEFALLQPDQSWWTPKKLLSSYLDK